MDLIVPDFLTLSILVLLSIILYFKYAYSYWKRKGFYNPQPSMPFGNMSDLFMAKKGIGESVADFYKDFKSKGLDFGGYYILSKPIFLAIDPELIKQITIKDFSYFVERGMHYDTKIDPLSGHLFSIRNPKWHELRTKFSPMFTASKLRDMIPILDSCGAELNKILEKFDNNGTSVDIKDLFGRFTTDMIASVAFGLDCNSLKNPKAELRQFGLQFLEPTLRNSLVLSLAIIAPKILQIFKIPICKKSLQKYFLEIIKYTVENREKFNINRNDMMNLLIQLKNNKSIEENFENLGDQKKPVTSITFEELAAQAFVFYLAGYETSSSTMSFASFELSRNQKIQEKAREEIRTVLKKYGDKITYEALGELSYLDTVIQETLRKYPVVPILNRECIRDYKIPGTDKIIEKGTSVVISVMGMHNDPRYFENPEVFDPDRFSPGRKENIDSRTYIPFGCGPRNCIGLRLGQIQTKIGLVHLLKNFRIKLDPEKKIPTVMNRKTFPLAFDDTIWLKLTKI